MLSEKTNFQRLVFFILGKDPEKVNLVQIVCWCINISIHNYIGLPHIYPEGVQYEASWPFA